MLKYLYLSLMLLFCAPTFALTPQSEDEKTDTASTVKFADRISIHTNTLGWLLMTPNIGVEYDLVHSKHKKVSLLLSGKINGQTNQDLASRYVYNIAGARAELRWYFRTRKIDDLGVKPEERINGGNAVDFRGPWEKERVSTTSGFFNKLWNSRGLVTAKQNPRRHRAYYVGPYAAYDKFSIKLTDTGYQGTAMGVGLSFGYTAPLYVYNNGNAIDFEVGAGVGAAIFDYDEYGYNSEDKCYIAGASGETKILPMLSDVRLSLVYRFEPIQNQAYEVNYDKLVKERHMFNLRKKYLERDTFMLSDSVQKFMASYNKKVADYNSKIRTYNREILKHENADSADLLTEQAPVFDYVRLPKKILNFGSDKELLNKEIQSAEELDDEFINDILAEYAPITNIVNRYTTRTAAVDALMLREYFAVRADTVSNVPYYDYLLKVIPSINAEAILLHNESMLASFAKKNSNDSLASRSGNIVSRVFSPKVAEGKILPTMASFIKSADTLVVKEVKDYSLPSFNDQIASENLNKVDLLREKYGIVADLGQIDHEKIAREKREADEKAKLAKEKAKQDAKAAKEKAKQDAKAAKEKAKQDAKAAKEKAKQDAKAAKEQAEADATGAVNTATEEAAEKVEEKVEEVAETATEAIEQGAQAVEQTMTKEQAKAAKALKKQQEKEAKAKAKAEEKARKEQAKAEKELKKQQEKAAKEKAKAEEKARKEQEKLEKEQSENSDADNSKNENSDEE